MIKITSSGRIVRIIPKTCPTCNKEKFEPVGTFGYLFGGYLSHIRCIDCGEVISIEMNSEEIDKHE